MVSVLSLIVSLSATLPADDVSIQGRLANDGGAIVDGTYTVAFRLFAASEGGSTLLETVQDVAVQDGVFSAALSGVTAELLTSYSELWLGLKVGAEPELPRNVLRSVPYAVLAARARDLACSGCISAGELAKDVLDPFATTASLAPVAFTGFYSDLLGAPELAAVATSGAYVDLSGTVPSAALSGSYGEAVMLTNPANQLAGDGAAIVNVPAASLTGTIAGSQLADGAVTDAHVDAAGAIAGTKIAPDFGGQDVITTGSVGIGVASPAARLDVDGDVRINGSVYGPVAGGYRIQSTPWVNISGNGCGSNPTGYMKLVTPIVENEGNMFSIKIVFYGYSGGGYAGEIRCGGYAYGSSTLINHGCSAWGVSFPYDIVVESRGGKNVVVVRVGSPGQSWYYQHFSYDYVGWQEHAPSTFQWVCGETS